MSDIVGVLLSILSTIVVFAGFTIARTLVKEYRAQKRIATRIKSAYDVRDKRIGNALAQYMPPAQHGHSLAQHSHSLAQYSNSLSSAWYAAGGSVGYVSYPTPQTFNATPFNAPTVSPPAYVDSPTPIQCWRWFDYRPSVMVAPMSSVNRPYLKGARGYCWPSRELEARCMVHSYDPDAYGKTVEEVEEHIKGNSCPDLNGCGIYGLPAPFYDHLGAYGRLNYVLARCLAYGTVGQDDEGRIRATHMQIEEMWLLVEEVVDVYHEAAKEISEEYGVPVKATTLEGLMLDVGWG